MINQNNIDEIVVPEIPSPRKNKYIIKGKLTIWDIIIAISMMLICVAIIMTIPLSYWANVLMILSFTVITLVTIWPLGFLGKEKFYIFIAKVIHYSFSKRKYDSNAINNDINLWKKIEDNYAFQFGNDDVVGFWNIEASNLDAKSEFEIINQLDSLSNFIRKSFNDIKINFYCLNENFDFDKEILNVENITDNNNKYLQKLKEIMKKEYENIANQNSDIKRKKYILSINGRSATQVNRFFNLSKLELEKSGLSLIKSTPENVKNLFNNLFSLPAENHSLKIKDTSLEFKRDYIKYYDATSQTISYGKTMFISSLITKSQDPFWLENLFNINEVIVSLQISSLTIKDRNKIVEGLKTDFLNVKQYKSEVKNRALEHNKNILDQLITDLATNSQDIKLCKILIFFKAKSIKELDKITEIVKIGGAKFGGNYDRAFFKQKEAFLSFMPFNYQLADKDLEILLTTDALGLSYPFTNTYLSDDNGFLLGYDQEGNPMQIDITNRQNKASGNAVILGMTGSRKSTLIKSFLLGSFLNKRIATSYVIDWENEYTKMAKNFQQTIFEFSSEKTSATINPLQIFVNDGQEIENFERHITQLTELLMNLIENRDVEIKQMLTKEVKNLYKKFDITVNTKCDSIPNNKWPLLKDLISALKSAQTKNKESKNDYKLLIRALQSFGTDGIYENLFNRHTNIKFNEQKKIVVFNLHSLLNRPENIKQSFLTSVLNYFNKVMIEHRRKHPYENDPDALFINLVVDEFHIIANEDNERALADFTRKFQQARKYYTNIIVATPSINSFTMSSNQTILKNVKTIIENAFYKFILSSSQTAVREINNKLLADTNKLTDVEIMFLSVNSVVNAGRFVLLTEANDRFSGFIWSGKQVLPKDFNVSVDKMTELAQLWGGKDND